MTTYISILRGINVSGHKIIKMDLLKKMCISLGFSNVQTYIQSGNILFQSAPTATKKLSSTIKAGIQKEFGFDVPVITLTFSELEQLISLNPFLNDNALDSAFFHATLLDAAPSKEHMAVLAQANSKNDKFELVKQTLYLYCPDGYGNTKLNNTFIEQKLKLSATTRNWKTLNQLYTLAGKLSE